MTVDDDGKHVPTPVAGNGELYQRYPELAGIENMSLDQQLDTYKTVLSRLQGRLDATQ